MEKKLVKGAIYSFIVSILIGIVTLPNSTTIHNGSGFVTEVYDSWGIFIYKLIKFSSLLTLITLLCIVGYYYLNSKKASVNEFFTGFAKGFIIVAAIIVVFIIIFLVYVWVKY